MNGDYESLRELLHNGADPNQCDEQGIPVLHLVIDSEADAYAQDGTTDRRNWLGQGSPPSGALVKLLLDAGADPNLKDGKGRTPLDWAMGFSIDVEASSPDDFYHPCAVEILKAAGGVQSRKPGPSIQASS